MNFKVERMDQLEDIAKVLLATYSCKVWTFTGNLGAGKTTFIKSICKVLGVVDHISSPTFSIINEYRTSSNSVFHMDWYRLDNIDQLVNIGIDEYLESGSRCLIEWPEVGADLLDFEVLNLQLVAHEDGTRSITVI